MCICEESLRLWVKHRTTLWRKPFRICTTLLQVSGPNDKNVLGKCTHVGLSVGSKLVGEAAWIGHNRESQITPWHRSTKASLSLGGSSQGKSIAYLYLDSFLCKTSWAVSQSRSIWSKLYFLYRNMLELNFEENTSIVYHESKHIVFK